MCRGLKGEQVRFQSTFKQSKLLSSGCRSVDGRAFHAKARAGTSQRMLSAIYAVARPSVSVRPSVRHAGRSVKNG